MNKDRDLIVVGGGIVGVSTALHALMRGFHVTLLDRGEPARASSYGNSGIIEASYVLPFGLPSKWRFPRMALNRDPAVHFHYLDLPRYARWLVDFYRKSQPEPRQRNGMLLRPLITAAIDEHMKLMQGTDAARHLSKAGRVKLHRSEESFAANALERDVARELGVPFEIMSATQFLAVEPDLKPVYAKAVRWLSSMRLTDPGAVVEAYRQRFVQSGGRMALGEAQTIRPNDAQGWDVQTSGGTFTAQHIAICTGSWTGELLKPLGYNVPLGIKRGYHQHFTSRGGAKLSHAIVDADIGYLICPMEQGYRLTTGIEFAALHAKPTPVQMAQILPRAREMFALGQTVDGTPWLGSRPCFADSLPVIGEAPRHPGLWFNFGHGHSGLTIGPPSGRLLMEMMSGEKPFCDPAPYRAERFPNI